MERNTEEITEIERHKYFLSEQKGYDVGWEFAEHDWEANFASDWRLKQANTPRAKQAVPSQSDGQGETCQDVVGKGVGTKIKKFFGLVFSR